MSKRRISAITLTAAVATSLLVGGGATAAQAASTDCASLGFYACVWEDQNYKTNGVQTGLIGTNCFIPRLESKKYRTTTINGHDNATSAMNAANHTPVRFYKNENYSGAYFRLSPGQGDGDFSNGTPAGDFDNTLDSMIFEDELTSGGTCN